MDIENLLKKHKKKNITLEELKILLHVRETQGLYILVKEAVEKGFLSPVKAAGMNGNIVYPLHLKYKIMLTEDNTKTLKKILMLHPAINKSGYLQSKPELFIKYKASLMKLSNFLFSETLNTPVSRKERSFQIFGNEKQLDDKNFCNLLDHLGFSKENLRYYDTPKYCFNDYIPERKTHMTLLVCENKDIWFNIRRRMYEDNARNIFGTLIDGVVFGCGNQASEPGAFEGYTRFLGTETINYLYWGDIDRAGLNIYLYFKKYNPNLNIRLFVPAYIKMLKKAENFLIPDSDDHRSYMADYESIYKLFSYQESAQLRHYIEANKRVPQEIVSYEDLLKEME